MYLCSTSLTQGMEYRHQISKSFTIIVYLKIRSYICTTKIDNVSMPIVPLIDVIAINCFNKLMISTFLLSHK